MNTRSHSQSSNKHLFEIKVRLKLINAAMVAKSIPMLAFILLNLFVGLVACQSAVGDLIIGCTGTSVCSVDPTSAAAMAGATCISSTTADFAARDALPQFAPNPKPSRWGPYTITYQNVSASQVPADCHPTAWAWRRIQEAVVKSIAMGMNYCHHHAPAYQAVGAYQIWCDGTNDATCVCSKAGENKTTPWAGLDCSNWSSFIYNYAFGYYPTSGIDKQACAPTAAPGRLVSTVSITQQDLFRTGDLMYISGSSTSPGVTHVVMFTGWQVDFTPGATGMLANATLVGNVSPSSQKSVVNCMKARLSKGLPVYVIADSTYNGPALRPLCGWYSSMFSHARRIINPDTALFPQTYNETVARYDTTAQDCISGAVLRT